MPVEAPESLCAEMTEGRWILVAETLDLPGHGPLRARASGLGFLAALAQHKRRVRQATGIAAALGLAAALALPNRYTATAQLLPPQSSQSAVSAMLGQFGELAGLAGRDLVKNPGALFVTLLRSRTVADRLIARFALMPAYREKNAADCREILDQNTRIEATKEGVIVIQVDDRDPRRAAALANGYGEELVRLNQNLAVGEAGRRRIFFEEQLHAANDQLAQAEESLKHNQEASGIVQLDTQAKALLESMAALRARIVVKEAQLRGVRTYEADRHPDVVRAQGELTVLRQELVRLQQQGDPALTQVSASGLPATGLEYVRRLREVKYREAIFEMLAKQLEAARIDEAREGALIQVIDAAEVPERKSGPRRWLIALGAGLVGLLLAMGWVAVGQLFRHWAADPVRGPLLECLQHSLWHKHGTEDQARPSVF